MKNLNEECIDKVKRKLKKRADHELFYSYLGKARKVGLHEEFIESVWNYINAGRDIGMSIEAALDDWGLS